MKTLTTKLGEYLFAKGFGLRNAYSIGHVAQKNIWRDTKIEETRLMKLEILKLQNIRRQMYNVNYETINK